MKLVKYKERNNIVRVIIVVTILCVFALSGVFLYNSFAIFTEEKNFNVINGEASDPGDIYFAYYVDGSITRSMPSQNTGYTLDTEKSNCTNGVVPKWNDEKWEFIGDYGNYNATEYTRTRWNLYFIKKVVPDIISNFKIYDSTPDYKKNACDTYCEDNISGVYKTLDDDGTSYYFRGSPTNNYVKFAGFYWRIIRINGNGSIRMIYDGTVAHDNNESSSDRIYQFAPFNTSTNDNMYVGYMYEAGNVHGLKNSSNVKNILDNIYATSLINYDNMIDYESSFCGDRTMINFYTANAGIGNTKTFYSGLGRLLAGTPTLKCPENLDNYTTNKTTKGNKALTYPIGLISMDEAHMAGYGSVVSVGYHNIEVPYSNPLNYLNTGYPWWTMTPVQNCVVYGTTESITSVFQIAGQYLDDNRVQETGGVGIRPVINLKGTLKFTGDGTKNNPFIPNI